MTLSTITVKAPGSMMLMGEHAVLHQEPAIVAAIDRWITVTLSIRNDEKLSIESVFGSLTQPIHQKPSAPWADWIFFLIRSFYEDIAELKLGLSIRIESTFEGAIGLSSSTALTVCLLFALAHWIVEDVSIEKKKQWVFEEAMDLLNQYGKVDSGAALQAVIYGGLRFYDSQSGQSSRIEKHVPCYLVYCGYKTPTEEVIKIILDKFKNNKKTLDDLFQSMGHCTQKAAHALKENCYEEWFACINQYYDLQKELGTTDDKLDHMIALSRQTPKTLASKISGAGLGDCIVVLGQVDQDVWRSMSDVQIIEIHQVDAGVQVC
jgi:mevalonate kinase